MAECLQCAVVHSAAGRCGSLRGSISASGWQCGCESPASVLLAGACQFLGRCVPGTAGALAQNVHFTFVCEWLTYIPRVVSHKGARSHRQTPASHPLWA